MCISMDLLLSATGQEDLFLVGNNASRRLPLPTGDLVWGVLPRRHVVASNVLSVGGSESVERPGET